MSPSSELLSPSLAKAPFDDPRADLILRSSDGVNFHVIKVILSLASPIFADMFTLPSPPASQNPSGYPTTVLCSEDAETLDLALRHCYPIRSPDVAKLRDARVLLEFARKYQVDLLEPSLTRFLTDSIERDPVGVYALAAAYECRDIAAKALRSSLALPIYLLQSPELQYSTTEQFQALIHYHILCGKVASSVAVQRKWIHSVGKLISTSARKNDFGCSACIMPDIVQDLHTPYTKFTRHGPRYLWGYLQRSALVLAHHPNADAVTAETFVLKDMDCIFCSQNKRREMLECSRVFAAEIRRVVEQVPLPTVAGDVKDMISAFSSTLANLNLSENSNEAPLPTSA